METHIGLLREENGKIVEAKLCHITKDGPIKPYRIYSLADILLAYAEYMEHGGAK